MSDKQENIKKYEEKLKEYAEKLDFSSNFSASETLSKEEHKMLIEGYKSDKFYKTNEFLELEKADLSDYSFWERANGGTNL